MQCFICTKHQQGDAAQGGVLLEDDLVYVGHIHALDGPTAYRGYLMVEPKRHLHMLGDLTDAEAAAIGRTTNRMARLLRDVLGTEARVLVRLRRRRRTPPRTPRTPIPRHTSGVLGTPAGALARRTPCA